jgi:hypothetical protein
VCCAGYDERVHRLTFGFAACLASCAPATPAVAPAVVELPATNLPAPSGSGIVAPVATSALPEPAPDLATPQSAWLSVQRAIRTGTPDGLHAVTSDHGFEAIVGSLDLERGADRESLAERWRSWQESSVRWESMGDARVAAFFFDRKGGPRLVFLRTANGWRLDDVWPGK